MTFDIWLLQGKEELMGTHKLVGRTLSGGETSF